MILQGHPIHELYQYIILDNPRLTLEFSKYIDAGYGRTARRNTFHIKGKEISEEWFLDQESKLSKGEELALHSKVECNSNTFHIPMMDFIFTKSLDEIECRIISVNQKLPVLMDIAFYDSGQSVHGYFFHLINEQQWYKYLGSLLLCNFTSNVNKEIIDTRWVGHTLEHGFSALRWSHNTRKYKSMPKLIDTKHINSRTAFVERLL